MEIEAGDLGEGMDAGVGATRALRQGRFAGNAAEGGLQLALDGGFAGLDLPAAEFGAVVGEGELEAVRGAGGLVEIGHGENGHGLSWAESALITG